MFSAYYSNAGVWLVKSMILVARGNMPEPRVRVDWVGPEIVDFRYPRYQYFGAFGIVKM